MKDGGEPEDSLWLQDVLFASVLRRLADRLLAQGFAVCAAASSPAWSRVLSLHCPQAERVEAPVRQQADTLLIDRPSWWRDGAPHPLDSWEALADIRETLRKEAVARHRRNGVIFLAPDSVLIGDEAEIGRGTVVWPGCVLMGACRIGAKCRIGPHTLIDGGQMGDGCEINASQLYGAVLGKGVRVGPYAHLRPGTRLDDGCLAGAFVEVKNAVWGPGSMAAHLAYVGDAALGASVNVGCGVVTCNYDGAKKHRTVVGDGAFIGSNSNLVAPVTIGGGAFVAAGSTITEDVPDGALGIARARQAVKPDWARKRGNEQAP